MKVGLILDESAKYDDYNWHDVYAEEFKKLGDEIVFLDFKKENWFEEVKKAMPKFIMWRAWHRPDDRDDAKRKIQLIEKLLKIPIFPNWKMYFCYDDKIIQSTLLKEIKIPTPKTWIFREEKEALDFSEKAKFPIVSKATEGACGDNVRKILTKDELQAHIKEAFSDEGIKLYFQWIKQKGYVYLQEFIEANKDLRIITIGNKVELAFWRENENSWKHNIAGGGRINPENIPSSAKKLCLKIAKKLNFHWCAFDIILKEGKPLLLEFSSIFGFSKCGQYKKHFGSPNANILKKQAEYLHNLFLK